MAQLFLSYDCCSYSNCSFYHFRMPSVLLSSPIKWDTSQSLQGIATDHVGLHAFGTLPDCNSIRPAPKF
jgi:hypothetical protein